MSCGGLRPRPPSRAEVGSSRHEVSRLPARKRGRCEVLRGVRCASCRFSSASSSSRGTGRDHEPHEVKAMTSGWTSGRGVSERDARSDNPGNGGAQSARGRQNDYR